MDFPATANKYYAIFILFFLVRAASPLVSYPQCTEIHNEWTVYLEGLHCTFNRAMFEIQAKLPIISTLILDGVGCSQDWNVLQWVMERLSSPGNLQHLSLNKCREIQITECDMTLLDNLTELTLSRGSLRFLHPLAFYGLKNLETITLKSLQLGQFPEAVTGLFNHSTENFNQQWLPNLKQLSLEANGIDEIPNNTFTHLPNLTYLDLSRNRLTRLDAEPFRNLENLQTLNVSLNLISLLPESGFTGVLPSLNTLVVSDAVILHLGRGHFRGLTQLKFLDLSFGIIYNCHPLSFEGLNSLEQVNFQFNPLHSVPEELLSPVNRTIRLINLSECKLSDMPRRLFEGLQQVEEVDLSKNKISSLENLSFKDSPKLRIFNVAHNFISNLPLNFFAEIISIEVVHLEENFLLSLGSLTFFNLRFLSSVNLSGNKLTAVSRRAFFNLPSFEVLDLSNNFLRNVRSDALDKISILKTLNLAGNRILNFPWLPFVNQHTGTIVSVDLHNNHLHCDCLMYSLIADHPTVDKNLFWPGANLLKNQKYKNAQELKCAWPPPLINQTLYVNLDEEYWLNLYTFVDISKFYCPKSCQCYTRCHDSMNITLCSNAHLRSVPLNLSDDINILNLADNDIGIIPVNSFAHMKYLLEINLQGNHISQIGNMFAGLPILNTIHLGDNNLKSLAEEDFQNMRHLKYLDLQHNSISNIEPNTFADLSNLQKLFLDHNHLRGLQEDVLNSTPFLSTFTLHDNPLLCDCDLLWLKDWLQTRTSALPHVDEINCTTLFNTTASVVYLEDDDFMCDTMAWPTTQNQTALIIAVCLGVLVLLITIFAITYVFRTVIQVVVYNRTGLRFRNKTDDSARDYLYDAFISFSSEDLEFVTQELVPKLESQEPAYKLCIHQRDFVVGECISTNIVNAVETSRRTLIVLSNHYITSQWCSFEFEAAHQQLLKDHQNRLIVILLEEVDRQLLNKDLKLYLSTNTYLERRDKLFWEKLYYAMPDKRRVNVQLNDNGLETKHEQDEVELQDDLQQLIF